MNKRKWKIRIKEINKENQRKHKIIIIIIIAIIMMKMMVIKIIKRGRKRPRKEGSKTIGSSIIETSPK